ncbi:MAG: hypothetical protein ACP5PW_08430, partial [Candidatus Dormibacteria bacterium]
VSLMGTVENGNRSDKRLNRHQIARIVQAFSPEALRDLVYIADSALVTGPNLDTRAAADLAWLSRLPDTFGVAATAKAAAWAADAWIPVGRVAESPRAATYAASEQTGTIGDRPYRLVVYRSSSLDRRKAKTLERELAAARAMAERAADTLCVWSRGHPQFGHQNSPGGVGNFFRPGKRPRPAAIPIDGRQIDGEFAGPGGPVG